jgi:Leucine-rich repeat (LRR) protein
VAKSKAAAPDDWWAELDNYGVEWRTEFAKMMKLKEGKEPTSDQLKRLWASTKVDLYVASGGPLHLAPLRRFPKVEDLRIKGFQKVDGLDVLRDLPLRKLSLRDDKLRDVGFLAELEGLVELDLMSNFLKDVGPLAHLTGLVDLNVGYNGIKDLTPLRGMTALEVLWIPVNQIADLSPLAGLTRVRELKANNNSFGDLAPLAKLTSLVELDVGGHFAKGKVTSVAPLAGMTKLKRLSIASHQNLSDLSPLAGCKALEFLDATVIASKVSFAALHGLPKLKQILAHREIMLKPDRDAFAKRRPKVDVSL